MMRLALPARAGLVTVGALVGSVAVVEAQQTWALTNARIETVTQGTIEKGTILIRNGLIAAIGAQVAVPEGARVIDLAGKTVVPGFIDLTSSAGLPAPTAGGGAGRGGGGGGFGRAANPNAVAPDRMIADEIALAAADARSARDGGITDALVAPNRGLLRGQSALIPMHDSLIKDQVVRSPVGMHIGYEGVGGGQYPSALLGVIAFQRQEFMDAQHQALIEERYAANPRGMERPQYDPELDALIPAVKGTMPVFMHASRENEIRRAVRLGKEFNLKLVILGAAEGFRALDALKGQTAVVAVNYPRAPFTTGWSYRGSRRHAPNDSAAADRAATALIEGNAAALHKAGIRFALSSGGTRGSEYLANVRKAIHAGLPMDVALAAMTIRAAEIAGADAMLGSIEQGKIANLVVSEGHPLADSAKVRMVFVDGQEYDVVAPATPARRGGAGGAGGAGAGLAPGALAGTWNLTLNSPQGTVETSLEIRVDGANFTGQMTSQFGTNPVSGTINGRQLSWNASITAGGGEIEIAYQATVDGTRMTGTASVGQFGSFPFTGEKRP